LNDRALTPNRDEFL